MKIFRLVFVFLVIFRVSVSAQENDLKLVEYDSITPGVARFELYKDIIKGKKVGVLINKSSLVEGEPIIDFLRKRNIDVVKIFSPEHGFDGNNDAGSHVVNGTDHKSGLTIISLYSSKHKKPTKEDLSGIDVMLVDLQDVGARFYTYISTMSLTMEACAENGIPVIVLDRPNPNGFYVDGPVLKDGFKSFVGMHHVPVVYGMTIGEYAKMVNGEKWLKNGVQCQLDIIPLKDYTHNLIVKLETAPSPNLPDWRSVYLYPSLCFFEGTIVSVGRGTEYPFQVFGHPDLPFSDFSFKPVSIPGKAANPKLKGEVCNGKYLAPYAENYKNNPKSLNLKWLLTAYKYLHEKHKFFNAYFDKLAGTDELRKQIESGMTEEQIRAGWKDDLDKFKKIREKYLIYK